MINESLNQSLSSAVNESLNTTVLLFGNTLPITNSPTIDIYIITIFASLFVTLVNKYMTDQVKIKALRAEMKELQKKMREHMTKNPEKAKQVQQDIMKKNLENMKYAMNPKVMFITMFPMLAIFAFIPKYYGQFGEFFNFLGLTTYTWFGTYIVFSIINSMIFKKILKVA